MKRVVVMSSLVMQMLFSGLTFAAQPTVFKTDQGEINLASLKGQVVYLDFWASWCKPCRNSFPWMNSLQQRFGKQGLKIIAVNVDKEQELMKKFLAEVPAEFTIAYDPEGLLAEQYQLKGMPSSYLLDRNGNLTKTHIGFRERDIAAMEELIKQELKK